VLVALGCGAVASPAVGATLTTKVDPAGAGTASAPKSQNVSFDIEAIKPGRDGHASLATTSVEMALPADFVSQVDRFAVCDKSLITGTTAKPKCPDDTVMGTSVAGAWIPSPSRGQYGGSEVRLDALSATWAVSGTVEATQPGPEILTTRGRQLQLPSR